LQRIVGVKLAEADSEDLNGRLTAAALAAFESDGIAGITLRSVAQRAGVPPATIQRQFQTKERLLWHVMAAFTESEAARMRRLAEAIGPEAPPIDALPALLCAETQGPNWRPQRAMLIEFLTAAARDANLQPLAKQWFDSTQRHWELIVGVGDLAGSLATFMVELEVAFALASIGCEGDLQVHLANMEVAQFALLGPGATSRFWFRRMLSAAAQEKRAYPQVAVTSEARAILDAGSDILVNSGSDAISFRSVAAHAGTTFSTVASIFRRKDILLSSICDHVVDRAMNIAPPPMTGPRDLSKICDIICDMLISGGRFYGKYFFLGTVEFRMLAARNSEYSHLAWRLRMMNGLYELRKDDPTYNQFGLDAFAVHARAFWSSGLGLIQGAIQPPDRVQPSLLARLNAGAPLFEATRAASG
jgi:AcrR family transcriptional regulator